MGECLGVPPTPIIIGQSPNGIVTPGKTESHSLNFFNPMVPKDRPACHIFTTESELMEPENIRG